jgi:hypothetical protein
LARRIQTVDLVRRIGERSPMKPHHAVLTAVLALSAIGPVAGPVPGPVVPVSSNERTAQPTEFSGQSRERPRVRVTPPAAYDYPRPEPYAWPGPGYVRQCADWYATEHRPSGTVITPQMRCRWVRG